MNVFIAIKFRENAESKTLIEKISHALDANGITHRCMERDHEKWGTISIPPKKLMKLTFQEIEASDFLLIDLSEKGVGLGIEAGYAYAKGIPIIVIAQQGSDVSTTLKGIAQEIFLYRDTKELSRFFKRPLFQKKEKSK